ncbi:hypothetical protein BDV23DRAFT_155239 [Aspergillus alliaceus]|uniref:Mitogen-activated protein kinase kinae kinase bck1 n=1 Tax=Petromyces alliaceus TaxID=209559 RepID=A0A5N7C9N0_PETAA|nr:hypothetical protein BDV23DRAFT_155239 [Aspergillus alliaceus]
MDGQRQQQYIPVQPPPSAQASQSHILLPPPPPRYQPAQAQGVVPPPPPGPPPGTVFGAAKLTNPQVQPQNTLGWQQNWAARQALSQGYLPPPPPPPLVPANQQLYNRTPLSIPSGEGRTSATYVPQPGTFGPGVGIPAFDAHSLPTYENQGTLVGSDRQRPQVSQLYEYSSPDSAYKRDGTVPATPSARTMPSAPAAIDGAHEQLPSQGQPTELTKSSSHRHNNSNTLPGGMSPSEAAAQWPLERVLMWLAKNGFSNDWQETFKALELQGADFIELGHGLNGRPNLGKLHNVVYPQLAKECENSGTGWDQAREREEGKRMRKLIRQIQEDGGYDAGIPIPKQRESQALPGGVPEGVLEASPNFAHEPASAGPSSGTAANSPNLKTLQPVYTQRQSVQTRSFTTPIPTTYDHQASDPSLNDSTNCPRSDFSRAALSTIGGDHRRQSPSVSSEGGHFFPPVRPYEDSPKSGSPATQHATLAHQGASSSTGDLGVKFEHSRGNSSDSITGRRYYESVRQDNARPSPQDSYNRQLGGDNPSSYSKDHSNRLLHFFKKRSKTGDSNHPSPEEQFLESPTSPVNMRQNASHLPYTRPNFSSSDMSLGERPSSSSVSDHERLARAKPAQKGKRWAFVTLDGWNYRLVDITDMESAENLRAAICQNLGISDWVGSQIFLTEPGQTDHDEPLNDANLTLCRRTKSDSFGSLKLFVRGSSNTPTGANSSPQVAGLGVSFPEKLTASPTSTHQLHRKPLDDEALNRIAKPTSPQIASRQQLRTPAVKLPTRDVSQASLAASPVDGGQDAGHLLDPDKADLLARHEEHQREVERKQKAYRISKVSSVPQPRKDAYGETGYRREGVIDFDSPRISPYEDKKAEPLVPLRKPPTAPHESHTLTKVNSLRKKDADRPRVQPPVQTHGLGAVLASVGRMTSAIGTPAPSVSTSQGDASHPVNTGQPTDTSIPDESRNTSQSPAGQDSQETPTSHISQSPKTATPEEPRPTIQSRKSFGPEFDFEETNVSFQRSPMPREESEDDSDDGLFAIPLANSKSPIKEKGSMASFSASQKLSAKPSLTVNTENRLRKGLSVSFRSPSATRETFASGGDPDPRTGSVSDMTTSPEEEKPPRRDSFARGDVWASRPPVEGVIEYLDDFFPNIDLDAPYLDGQGASPPSSPASRVAHENELIQKEKPQPPPNPPDNTLGSSEPTIKAQDPNIVARRNVNRSGGLTRMKSIREVARGANQASRNRSVTSSTGNQKSGDILRRKSTKMFGARIMQISPKPGSRLSQLDPIPQNNAPSANVPQRQPTFRIIRGQLIGKGTYGRVYLGMNADNGEVLAVKQVEINPRIAGQDKDKMKDMVAAMDQEIDTMQHLEHPNIVQYLGCERGELSISIYLEYISGGSIGSCLRKHGKFEESVVKSLTRQTLSGLAYLHDQGILHRDLKADNILLDLDGTCKISDFGISKKSDNIYGNDSTNSMQGSVFWMAPEVIQSQGQGYSAKVDIWSLGCVVLEMFAGRRPWSREEAIGAIFKLGSLSQAPPIPEDVSMNISPAALAFMYDCFTIDSLDRPTAETLLTRHPFCEPDLKYNFLDTELYAKIRHVL